ncbi:MAG: phosphoglycerate mutase family protein [Acidimicrobiales bacterium]|nr:phosphoglycerate mutase family protein [Acidimicrobiales bacterium]
MSLFLVRHAHALGRSGWSDDDLDRPLSDRGREQAALLTTYFADHRVRAVYSSQAVRCVDTVAATAEAHAVELEVRRELTEGARPNDLLELLRAEAVAGDDVVLCSHGDLIPEVLNRLLREGMSVLGARGCEKGSVWELETRGRDITRGVYTAVPGHVPRSSAQPAASMAARPAPSTRRIRR